MDAGVVGAKSNGNGGSWGMALAGIGYTCIEYQVSGIGYSKVLVVLHSVDEGQSRYLK